MSVCLLAVLRWEFLLGVGHAVCLVVYCCDTYHPSRGATHRAHGGGLGGGLEWLGPAHWGWPDPSSPCGAQDLSTWAFHLVPRASFSRCPVEAAGFCGQPQSLRTQMGVSLPSHCVGEAGHKGADRIQGQRNWISPL